MVGLCNRCGAGPRGLHTHHKCPRSQGGTDDPTNIEKLCANCHEDEHGGPMGGSLGNAAAHTPEAKAKRSATLKRLWQDPTYRRQHSEGRKRAWAADPERRQRTSELIRRWYVENPEAASERAQKIAAARNKLGLKVGQRIGESETEWRARVIIPRSARRRARRTG